jgi:hypothetical protein
VNREPRVRYNILRQKAVQYIYAVSEGQVIQPPTTTVGEDESERNISVLHIPNHHY